MIEDATYFHLFNTPDGKLVLEDLRKTFYDCECYAKGDSHETTYLNGSRYTIGYILNKIASAENPIEEDNNG